MEVIMVACKNLDYDEKYHNCKRQILGSGEIFWLRDVGGDTSLPTMVQFCKLKGRLNSPYACTKYDAPYVCEHYEDFKHVVDIDD